MVKIRTRPLALNREEKLPFEPQIIFPVWPTCTSWMQQNSVKLRGALKCLPTCKDKVLSFLVSSLPSSLQPSRGAKFPHGNTEAQHALLSITTTTPPPTHPQPPLFS